MQCRKRLVIVNNHSLFHLISHLSTLPYNRQHLTCDDGPLEMSCAVFVNRLEHTCVEKTQWSLAFWKLSQGSRCSRISAVYGLQNIRKWKNFGSNQWQYWFPEVCASPKFRFKLVASCCGEFREKPFTFGTELQLFTKVENQNVSNSVQSTDRTLELIVISFFCIER